jgi:MoxR-like ATPase
MNPWDQAGYRGTNQLNIAMLDRFDIIEVDYLSIREETKLLENFNDDYDTCRKWAEFAAKTRIAYTREGKVTNVITTRKLIDYVQHVKVLAERTVVQRALAHFITDERTHVAKLWGDENFRL